ncbi:DUF4209 domain-containing protein [Myceligenerans crystallogenes]|uniref:DUF4209 domain-containing protein n=1 Tax=Myceligenerans crystallogenes TaxID=316335 RepID=A0ABN2N9C0_9MICO
MTLTVEAFRAVASQVSKAEGTPSDLHDMERDLRSVPAEADDDQRDVQALLADICSYDLAQPLDAAEPYRAAIWLVDGRRTAMPEDLTEEQIGFLATIRDQIGSPWLRARICDVLWIKNRDHLAARTAVVTWAGIPVDENAWFEGGAAAWERALDLSQRLNLAEGHQLQQALHDAVLVTEQFAFAGQVSDVLLGARVPATDGLALLERLAALAEARSGGEERDLLEAAKAWAQRLRKEETRADLLYSIVQSWMAESEEHARGERPSAMLAARCLEQALQTFRKIPRKERERLGIADLELQLRARHKTATSSINDELTAIRTEFPADGEKMAEHTRQRIAGCDRGDVLVVLGTLFPARPYAELFDVAQATEEGSISSLFESVSLTPEGRKARVTRADDEIHGVRAPVWRVMERAFNLMAALTVREGLAPALAVVQAEHALREQDFADLVAECGQVPADHRYLFTHGLWCIYKGDIAAGIHILVPQIEAFVRTHLQFHGVATTTIDKEDSVENEVGLSTLVRKDEMEQVFGPDLTLYFRMMFEGPAGLNVRNTVAHGVLTDDAVETVTNLFVWWFALYLVTMPVAVRRRTRSDVGSTEEDLAGGGPVAANDE